MNEKQEYEQGNGHQKVVRNMVLQAIEQVKEGRTKDYNEVFERLEKKYTRT